MKLSRIGRLLIVAQSSFSCLSISCRMRSTHSGREHSSKRIKWRFWIPSGISVWIVRFVSDNIVALLVYLLSMVNEMRRTRFPQSLELRCSGSINRSSWMPESCFGGSSSAIRSNELSLGATLSSIWLMGLRSSLSCHSFCLRSMALLRRRKITRNAVPRFIMRECTALPVLVYNKQYFWIMYPMVPWSLVRLAAPSWMLSRPGKREIRLYLCGACSLGSREISDAWCVWNRISG